MRWLVSDWDARDPQDDLEDIESGRYLEALTKLPRSIRQLLEDNDMRITLREMGDQYRVVKIVKKREPEFLQGNDNYYTIGPDGQRIPIDEAEMDARLGIEHNPEDVYEQKDIEFEDIHHEHVAPMDTWDITYDAVEFVQKINSVLENEGFRSIPKSHQISMLEQMSEDLIYSADWFPYAQDKRIKHPRAKRISQIIQTSNLSKKELAKLMVNEGPDKRLEESQKLIAEAKKMPKCKGKVKTLILANKLKNWYLSDRKAMASSGWNLSQTDKAKLWDQWREKQLKAFGSVKLPEWLFKKFYKGKLTRLAQEGKLPSSDINKKVDSTAREIYKYGHE